ncbi:MAG: YggT family protein [Gemmatimonadota bacterium]|nr:MAG: YggT family protein [Gemmatimonadota bacterium]
MELLNFLITLYIILLLVRLFLPWSGELLFNPLYRGIVKLTEPVLQPLRRIVPKTRTGFDVSPLVGAIVLILLRGFILGLAQGLKGSGALLVSAVGLLNLIYGAVGILLLGVLFVSMGSAFSYSRFTQVMLALTDPIIYPIRRFTGFRERGVDWAPVVGIVLVIGLRSALMYGLFHMSGASHQIPNIRNIFAESTYLMVDTLITFLMIVMIARAVVSWINLDPYNPLVQTVIFFSDPILTPIRRAVPAWTMGLDFSPMFGVILLMIVRYVVHRVV